MKNIRTRNCLSWLISVGLVFLFSGKVQADNSSVYINEVCWMGSASSTDEWIELKNGSNEMVDFTGWTIEDANSAFNIIKLTNLKINPGGYFLLERTDNFSALEAEADLIFTGTINDENEKLILKDPSGKPIDEVDASPKWPAGDKINRKTMERKSDGGWQTSAAPGGTPGTENSDGSPAVEVLPEDNPSDVFAPEEDGLNEEGADEETDNSQATSTSLLGDILINELVSDPTDGENEWVELYNATNKEINLAGWTIEEGSGAKTGLSGQLGINENERFYIIEKINGNLNNIGDIIKLRDGRGNLIDQVAYGAWDDGDKSNNAPTAGDPKSVARKFDGLNTFNNQADFAVTVKPTKKAGNLIASAASDENPSFDASKYDFSDDIFITEIYPSPQKGEEEFIEIYNAGQKDINLFGWIIRDSGTGKYQFPDSIGSQIKDGGYLVLTKATSKITLNNDTDSVSLFPPGASNAQQALTYENTIKGQSYAVDFSEFKPANNWHWTEKITPGKINIISLANREPVISFLFPKKIISGQAVAFDASDSYDEDGDILKYKWDFGDGITSFLESPEHVYAKPGKYLVKFFLSDRQVEVSQEKAVLVTAVGIEENLNNAIAISDEEDGIGAETLIINEIFPNPVTGGEEWVELKNIGEEEINLTGWSVDDADGGSKPYKFPQGIMLDPGGLYVLKKAESKIAFNNSNDSVRLFFPDGRLAEEVDYGKTYQGKSYAIAPNGQMIWTGQVSPGSENNMNNADISDLPATGSGAKTKAGGVSGNGRFQGIVLVKPGVLGAQFFYMASLDNSSGYQIYNYKKDFPKLNIGDLIEVSGELGFAAGEPRIKIKIQSDIKILKNMGTPKPHPITSTELSEDYMGSLVEVAGVVTDKKGQGLYLDDGDGEIYAYIKQNSGISMSTIKEGDQLKLIGVVGASNGNLRVLPRQNSDLEPAAGSSAVLGDKIAENWSLSSRSRKLELIKYFFIILGGLVIAGAIWLIRKVVAK
jgi:hypothetical protein